jgi:hypothetical protein
MTKRFGKNLGVSLLGILRPATQILIEVKSLDAEMQTSRIADKTPCYYAREYQIPDAPKISQMNTHPDVEPPLQIPIFLESLSSLNKVKKSSITNLDDLFEDKKVINVNLNSAPLKGILKKPGLNEINPNELAFSHINELDSLRTLVQILGLQTDSVDEYLTSLNSHLRKQPEFDIESTRSNLLSVRNMAETFHKFRIQFVHGKSRPFLPVSYKESLPQSMANQNNHSSVGSTQIISSINQPQYPPMPIMQPDYSNELGYQQANYNNHLKKAYNQPSEYQSVFGQHFQQNQHNQQLSYSGLQNYPTNYSQTQMIAPTLQPPQQNPQLGHQQQHQKYFQPPYQQNAYQKPQQSHQYQDQTGNAQRKHLNTKRKTVPCRLYHSEYGCKRDDNCDFIHDANYKGVPTPNMDRYVRPFDKLSRNQDVNTKNQQKYQGVLQSSDQTVGGRQSYGHDQQQRHHYQQQGFHQNHDLTQSAEQGEGVRYNYPPMTPSMQDRLYMQKFAMDGSAQNMSLEKRYYQGQDDHDAEKRIKYN